MKTKLKPYLTINLFFLDTLPKPDTYITSFTVFTDFLTNIHYNCAATFKILTTTAIESVESVSSFSPLCNIIIYLWNIFAVSYFEVCLQGSLIFQALFHKWKRRKSQSHCFPKTEKKCKFKTRFKIFFACSKVHFLSIFQAI